MRNPYHVLGVSPQAGPDEIKSAYRRLAKTYHPDSGSGDPHQKERFHEVTAAYDLLSRKAKTSARNGPTRRRHAARAASEDTNGQKTQTSGQQRSTSASRPKMERPAEADPKSAATDQLSSAKTEKSPAFADILTNLKRVGRRALGVSGSDHQYELSIPFLDAVEGTKRRLTLDSGKSLDVHIPAGVEDGQQIRLRGQGDASLTGRDMGDALVTISVAPHPTFRREGADIHIDVPVSLAEAVLGAKITVPTVEGDVAVSVPEGSNSGSVLRLKGKGLTHPPGARKFGKGDQFVHLTLVLPPKPDQAIKDFAATWAPGLQHAPRKT
ncbi:MAG: J domain-containing protein [Rhodobiaceae bacterium]|nr:J domain-containing protein [Rhodobiaceae bacterium]